MTRPVALLMRTLLLAWALVSPLAQAQKLYPTPEAAATALVEAMRANDKLAMQAVLGKDWKRFIPTDEIGRDDVNAFLAGWDQEHRIAHEDDRTALLSVGSEPGFTLPIPIVRNSAALWRFDVVRGTDRLRVARIGRNELAAMQAALAYYDAQREYASADRSGRGAVPEYARKLVSTPGKRDGLYWPAALDAPPSPLGPLIARQKPKGPGYWGYHYRILTGQGQNATGGAYDYVIGGRMRGGFALVAWPVRYGDTGVMTFMVSHAGTVFEKDLGPGTDAVARAMRRFDPDPSWNKSPVP
jgi:type II secretory pathway pseudopilin PulG